MVREQVYGALDRARYLFDGRDTESERYVNRGEVRAEVRLYNHRIEVEEWGPVEIPAFDSIRALELRAISVDPVTAEQ